MVIHSAKRVLLTISVDRNFVQVNIFYRSIISHTLVCKSEHRVWPKNHLDKQMSELLEEFRTAGRVHRLTFKKAEIEYEKTFLDDIELSLQNTSLNDTRNFDETTETT